MTADVVLEPFLSAPEGSEEEEIALAGIAERARGIIRSVLRSKGGATPVEPDELLSETFVRLLRALRTAKKRGEAPADFSGYVAVIAYNILHSNLRQRHRARNRLRNRIRFVLEEVARFAVWETPRGVVAAGLAQWRGMEATASEVAVDERGSVELDALTAEMLADAFDSIFARTRAPMEIERLVETIADCFHVTLAPQEIALGDRDIIDPRADVEEMLASRSHLSLLWSEIEQLPERQRAALLLNLRDSNGAAALGLLVLLGIATLARIASAIGMSEQALSAAWDALPFDDRTIAERLAITRQQVINLRKSARERLARRLFAPVISGTSRRRMEMKP